MMGKKPTKKQKQYIRNRRLNAENWLVCKDTPIWCLRHCCSSRIAATRDEMLLKYRYADKYRTLRKKAEGAS